MAMDFNPVKKLAAEAATAFSRAKQYTEEKLGTSEKTELDANFENLAQRADRTRLWTERVLSRTEMLLTPNPKDYFMEKLATKPRDRLTNSDQLGIDMIEAGTEFGPGTAYGSCLIKVGHTQQKIGTAEREFVQAAARNFIQPLRRFLDGDMKTILRERKMLETRRLDLDACKSRLRKARSTDSQQALKDGMTLEELITQAERDLRNAQTEFDRQVEITKLLLEGVSSAHANHLRCLHDFVQSQVVFHAQCQRHMADLQKELANASMSAAAHLPSAPPQPTTNYPSLFIDPASPPSPDDPPLPASGIKHSGSVTSLGAKRARVLYDYDATSPMELSLLADEVVTVYSMPGLGSDWMMAERGTQKGKVPLAYLEIMN